MPTVLGEQMPTSSGLPPSIPSQNELRKARPLVHLQAPTFCVHKGARTSNPSVAVFEARAQQKSYSNQRTSRIYTFKEKIAKLKAENVTTLQETVA
ncbi:hypothetical protein C368_01279 [Cryptococcus neoformans 125.91]|nr:hypothetical protein C353_00772 [Cryptococcus neoformans var. grubii AD1-83a]OWZ58105.1 hypothetical protein C368_01279 [Cryptococcus neoformans var. grubii 125.91]OXG68441.1 hypothetical protein C351_00773 [Cryptococcus neoformans var. grubii c8]OXG69003.1 hypothetical protein C354_00775 [Cryptococcus neoformans var. grubii MW-RSA1955]OXG88029.1 hypothetical protein C350_00761 [Cryptococcus neoformans var. grubii MW-RSA36]OXH18227.1 hypothetical protein C369_00770 [Cryptococcus neoformans 